MDSILYCRLNRFYIHLLGLGEERPCAVIRDRFVLDSNANAARRGVTVGMPFTQARTILREEGIFRKLLPEEGESDQKRWLDLCTEYTGVIEPEDRHSAYLDLSGHPNPFDIAQRLVDRLASFTGCETRFGVGASRWLARLSADIDGERLTPLAGDGMADLSILKLSPVLPEHRERLRFLGYHSVGLVAGLPIDILRSQFGDDGLRISLAAKGAWNDPVQALYPPDTMSERLIFDGVCDDTQMLDRALLTLARRIGRRLLNKDLQATEVQIDVEFEEASKRCLKRRFNKPVCCPRTAIAALRLMVGAGYTTPVLSLGVRLPHLERALRAQKCLMGGLTPAESSHRVESAMRQIRSVFGEASIQIAGQIPLPRRVRVLKEWKNATGWR